MGILEFNVGTMNTLPGPVSKIICQSGQVIVIDNTVKPPEATTLNPDDTFDAEGKAGLQIVDVDGSRIWTESSLEDNRTQSQMVTSPDVRPEVETDLHGEPTENTEEPKTKAKKKTKAKA